MAIGGRSGHRIPVGEGVDLSWAAFSSATLLSLGVATFVLCQTIAYWWLPEGLLRGRSFGALATGEKAARSFGAEWARIVAFKMATLLLFYVAANLIRLTIGVPLGYNTVIVMQGYFGVITGTNSFTLFSEKGKIAPSLYWLVTPGFYELGRTPWPRQLRTRSPDGRTSGSRARRRQSGSRHPRGGGATHR